MRSIQAVGHEWLKLAARRPQNKKLLRKAIQPAKVEVNGMDNFGVKIEPIRKGAASSVSAFPGGKRDIAGLQDKELKRPKVGRMAERLDGTAIVSISKLAYPVGETE